MKMNSFANERSPPNTNLFAGLENYNVMQPKPMVESANESDDSE